MDYVAFALMGMAQILLFCSSTSVVMSVVGELNCTSGTDRAEPHRTANTNHEDNACIVALNQGPSRKMPDVLLEHSHLVIAWMILSEKLTGFLPCVSGPLMLFTPPRVMP